MVACGVLLALLALLAGLPPPHRPGQAGLMKQSDSGLPPTLPIPPVPPPAPEQQVAADQAPELPIPPVRPPTPEAVRAEADSRLEAFERALHRQSRN